jgi:hypothetical protein
MKVSIWQQFSSNHSNSYVVIGEFKSVADTENAATTMKQILKQIYDWYADDTNKALADDVRDTESHPPTPAENQITTTYNVTFDYAMDWIARQKDTKFIDDAVVTLNNHIFIACTDETTSTDTQFAQLVDKLGGTVNYHQEIYTGISTNITCIAPNEKTADGIVTAVRNYLQRDSNSFWQRPPWVLYYDGKLAAHPEQISAEVEIFIEHERAMREWGLQNKDERDKLIKDLTEAHRKRDEENAEVLKELLRDMYETQKNIQPKLEPDREVAIREILSWAWAETRDEDDKDCVTVEDNHIKIKGLYLMYDVIGRTIKAIIAWLEAQGCENVLYQFEVIKYR